MLKKLFILLFLLVTPVIIFSQESSEIDDEASDELLEYLANLSEEERDVLSEFFSLDWKESGTYKLTQSNSTLCLPEGYWLTLGNDAKKTRQLNGSIDHECVEAAVYDKFFNQTIVFETINNGYLSIEDCLKIDSRSLLRTIKKNTAIENVERRKKGLEELNVIGWIKEPTIDRLTNTVYWAIEASSEDEGNFVNSTAIRLSRFGHERIVWITDKEQYVSSGGHLDVLLRSYTFDPGYRYQDFVKGDKMAKYSLIDLLQQL